MSSLTKVFVLLVSAASMFLCGVVVTFVANTENWRDAYYGQQSLAEAAQVQAVAAEDELGRSKKRSAALIERLNDQVLALERESSNLLRELTIYRQAKSEAESRASTAVAVMQSLQQTVDNMYNTQNAIQTELAKSHKDMIVAQSQVIDLTRELNGERVKSDRLESKRRQAIEKITELEDENASIRQKLQEVTVTSSEVRQLGDKVSLATPRQTGVPIRGQIVDLENDLAAISVGSAAGVRKDMTFLVVRGDTYLGDLKITHVEATEAAGRIQRKSGTIVTGDRVTTGFD